MTTQNRPDLVTVRITEESNSRRVFYEVTNTSQTQRGQFILNTVRGTAQTVLPDQIAYILDEESADEDAYGLRSYQYPSRILSLESEPDKESIQYRIEERLRMIVSYHKDKQALAHVRLEGIVSSPEDVETAVRALQGARFLLDLPSVNIIDDYYVDRVEHEVSPSHWLIRAWLSPADMTANTSYMGVNPQSRDLRVDKSARMAPDEQDATPQLIDRFETGGRQP